MNSGDFSLNAHTHNDLYYTKNEISNSYYTKVESNSLYASSAHSHDDDYYNKTETDEKYLSISGGTLTGDLNLSNLLASGVISGDGGGVTNLNADNISKGTIDSARLPSNIDADMVDGFHYNDTELKPFGGWINRSANTIYLAETDGFVMAAAETITLGPAGIIYIYTDGSNPPTTKRGTSTSWHDAPANYGSSACVPVKAGDYYKITLTQGIMTYGYWIPLGG
jgi:hypothetical protein